MTHFQNRPPGAGPAWLAGTETISDPKGGEARHLDIALKALADVRRIWGLEAPSKLDIIASVESRPVGERLSQVTAELASLLPGSVVAEQERTALVPKTTTITTRTSPSKVFETPPLLAECHTFPSRLIPYSPSTPACMSSKLISAYMFAVVAGLPWPNCF